jgi:hypothetical protein
MLVLGVILLVLCGGALLAAIFGGSTETATFDLGPVHAQTTTFSVFLVGVFTVVLFAIGVQLVRAGVRRARQRRSEKKELARLTEKLQAHEAGTTGGTSGGATGDAEATGSGAATDQEPGTSTSTDSTLTDSDRQEPGRP